MIGVNIVVAHPRSSGGRALFISLASFHERWKGVRDRVGTVGPEPSVRNEFPLAAKAVADEISMAAARPNIANVFNMSALSSATKDLRLLIPEEAAPDSGMMSPLVTE